MPTPVQVGNRRRPWRLDHHYVGTVTVVGPPCKVALDPGGATVTALCLATVAAGQRVLVVVTQQGNYVLGRIQ